MLREASACGCEMGSPGAIVTVAIVLSRQYTLFGCGGVVDNEVERGSRIIWEGWNGLDLRKRKGGVWQFAMCRVGLKPGSIRGNVLVPNPASSCGAGLLLQLLSS